MRVSVTWTTPLACGAGGGWSWAAAGQAPSPGRVSRGAETQRRVRRPSSHGRRRSEAGVRRRTACSAWPARCPDQSQSCPSPWALDHQPEITTHQFILLKTELGKEAVSRKQCFNKCVWNLTSAIVIYFLGGNGGVITILLLPIPEIYPAKYYCHIFTCDVCFFSWSDSQDCDACLMLTTVTWDSVVTNYRAFTTRMLVWVRYFLNLHVYRVFQFIDCPVWAEHPIHKEDRQIWEKQQLKAWIETLYS